jgi:hypothetical protein
VTAEDPVGPRRAPLATRWVASDEALGRPVSRGVVLSAGPGDFVVVLHPGEVVWSRFAEPSSLAEAVETLCDLGATEADARTYAEALIEDLVGRRLLRTVR